VIICLMNPTTMTGFLERFSPENIRDHRTRQQARLPHGSTAADARRVLWEDIRADVVEPLRFIAQQSIEAGVLVASQASDANGHNWFKIPFGLGLPGHIVGKFVQCSVTNSAEDLLAKYPPVEAPILEMDMARFTEDERATARDFANLVQGKLRPTDRVEGMEPFVRRHRPRSLTKAYNKVMSEMSEAKFGWCVPSGDLVEARTQLSRVAEFCLGIARGATILPRSPLTNSTSEKSYARFALRVGEDEFDVVPELLAKLTLYAAFRERDHALLMTLKGHAITWLKEEGISFLEGGSCALSSTIIAWIPGAQEKAAMRLTAAARVQESVALPRNWLNDGASRPSLGLGSVWNPLYHAAKFVGLANAVKLHRA
jgi:hypothetical protein